MKAVKVNTGKHYRGIIQGQEKRVVAILQRFEYTREELYGTHKDDARALSDCVRLYLEVDHDIFLNKGQYHYGYYIYHRHF
ncbi:MAG: hypothetical protein IPL08_13655 [Saprospiraceae bacterium]|nr:hypothetical protein [Saprospiraceae bacterium]